MLFGKVDHVAIIVSDYDKSKEFYVNKLGLNPIQEVERPDRGSKVLYLDASNVIIEMFCFPNSPLRASYPEAQGLRHLAFEVEDFDGTLEKLCSFISLSSCWDLIIL